jgi:hypothetical protein
MVENKIELKAIRELLGMKFFIPSYQRGYRWTERQVKDLLDDVYDFKGEWYCLQPLVVKERNEVTLDKIKNANDLNEVKNILKGEWEVIDGQQRLTTIYIILSYLSWEKKYFIEYETKINSKDFLAKIDKNKRDDDIDYYHMVTARKQIEDWFSDKDEDEKKAFYEILLDKVQFIWYESVDKDPIEIFTRLNIGKIPLTNAELIKALFLQKGNFAEEKATLKQIQIASEWDTIEKALQDDAFWFFINNPNNLLKYDNRIEYIFDLMRGRTKDCEYYYTFNEFHKDLSNNQKESKLNFDNLWLEIKRYFLTLEEWFKDYELFHYVGYLVDCKKNIDDIKKESLGKTKMEFKEYLKMEIKKEIDFQIQKLDYNDSKDKIKKVLLLFNIQTVLETQKSDMRFPFHKYKLEKWDIEHVRSQSEKDITGKDRWDWIKIILEYFTGSQKDIEAEDYISIKQKEIDKLKETIQQNQHEAENIKKQLDEIEIIMGICSPLIKMLKHKKIEDDLFDKSQTDVLEYFNEDVEPEGINNISNLALLDASTNRSYQNAFFPIKRKRIIENDKNGIFVPITTRNLFLKYYSKKIGNVMYWNKEDAKDYLDAMKRTLKSFLPEINQID